MLRTSLVALRRVVCAFPLIALAPAASAQAFNVDIGANLAFPAPTSAYAAAGSQPGTWNAVSAGILSPIPLLDTSGAATTATILHFGGAGNFDFNNAGTSGDDQALMDDAQDIGGTGASSDWIVQGVTNGTYRVYVYAWASDTPTTAFMNVSVVGGEPCQQLSGGANWTGAHVVGATYVTDLVRVANNKIEIRVETSAGIGKVCGVQITPTTASIGSVIRGPINLRTLTGNDNARAADYAFGYFWIAADADPAHSQPTCIYQFTAALAYVATWPTIYDKIGDFTHDTTVTPQLLIGKRLVSCFGGTTPSTDVKFSYTPTGSTGTLAWVSCVDADAKWEGITVATVPQSFWGFDIFGNLIEYHFDMSGNMVIDATYFIPFTFVGGLAHDPGSGKLWLFSQDGPCPGQTTHLGTFHQFDPMTGLLTGLDFRAATVDNPDLSASAEIYEDPLNPGFWSILAVQNTAAGVVMIGYDLGTPVCGSAATSYCTAKINSLGCTPFIAGSGTASATASSGFVVSGTNVRNNKQGLLFYGTSGQAAAPFQGGTLCVKAPIRRTPVVNSGGTPPPSNDCSGALTIDMNTFARGLLGGTPSAALSIAGTAVNSQWWSRDPGFPAPNNTSLTDGLQYTVCP